MHIIRHNNKRLTRTTDLTLNNIVTLKCGLGSLKIIKNGFLFTFHSNYGRIFTNFGDIQRQRMA